MRVSNWNRSLSQKLGVPVEGKVRVQLNLNVEQSFYIQSLKNFRTFTFPVMWLEEVSIHSNQSSFFIGRRGLWLVTFCCRIEKTSNKRSINLLNGHQNRWIHLSFFSLVCMELLKKFLFKFLYPFSGCCRVDTINSTLGISRNGIWSSINANIIIWHDIGWFIYANVCVCASLQKFRIQHGSNHWDPRNGPTFNTSRQ